MEVDENEIKSIIEDIVKDIYRYYCSNRSIIIDKNESE